jgi:hypothetical protein
MATKEQMLQEVRDEKDRMKADKAYGAALRNTEYAPKVEKPKSMGSSEMPKVNEMGDATGYKKGGMTASKRADGCCVKGKTRGTMITMKGGGYAC